MSMASQASTGDQRNRHHDGSNPPPSQGLEKRAVVSSLIFKFPDGESGKPQVALFRRSEKVRTYKHHLAPISGSIESTDKDPLCAAWREIYEETTLTPRDLTLWRVGKPFTFSDASVGREWTVSSFAFKLKPASEGGRGEEAITIDWEHESWEWHDPRTVVDDPAFGGVPRLHETLRRVWFKCEMNEPAARALEAGLKRLREDHESGAHELTVLALTAFRECVVQMRDGLDAHWWGLLCMAAWHLVKNGRESMGAATLNALLAVLADIDEIRAPQTPATEAASERTWDRVLSTIDFHLSRRKSSTARVTDAFTAYLTSTFLSPTTTTTTTTNDNQAQTQRPKLTILTLSASSTIRDSILTSLAALPIPTLELRILESRPLFEGASLASSIYSRFKSEVEAEVQDAATPHKSLLVELYTDASAALAAKDADILLFGADRISSSRGVSNKTGSLPAVLSARHAAPGIKVVVLSELEKVVGGDGVLEDTVEENDPREVVSAWRSEGVKAVKVLEDGMAGGPGDAGGGSSIRVRNVYFEWVPLALVDAFVSDEGVLDEGSIERKSEQLAQLAEKYFGDL
ncbi:translation initiation factor eIF-2B subunit family protein [Aspergillus clavatus NRRL 1]|uniref:Translation initiation factor eIF-2B subunit family protein n=1 Tax=Aspergillus clavatus (strain ATCC 1007 / CBS 513.65 / DSM 816 / NCTC 3887 / NRRL 1 / QM 1276 / 107) TaxID=344612 RepID=A1C7C4_ASPCL|nr:translation initiation factor eIF-2B subunit family protein [Aspergillus clavatus NRRL 1]EAW14295.1 translation initiation factor eIF-2B subunit family protein [Aspergillus clavatus NRRL 1]